MKISVCVTTLNEEASIAKLLDSLISQSNKPDEIVIVDGGSVDDTINIITHYQKRYKGIKILKEECSRAKGRNLAVEVSRNQIIAMTDAGCIAKKDWLKKISLPFENNIDVAAGFYEMSYKNKFQKACSFFLGTLPNKFDAQFLPSTRSIAFTKEIWERVGGFPESLNGAAEDTIFNLRLINNNAKISRVKNSVVEWGMPGDIKEFFNKIFTYAKGDAKSKVWIFPNKGVTSHNIKALFILFRYLIALYLLYISIFYNVTPLFLALIIIYLFWAFRKVFLAFGDYKAALWGPVLQVASDIAVIFGFISGLKG